ncbi:MAG: 2-oxoacid:acceptor oxidoreductase family protein [Verrucomicrobia bacterium]|nr:2-oxoacid:acceptor oxidoreductase family protein [Verrucomicrobiota bacterium]MDA1086234.1 2-oxoacid:acceptor oxidoreductase family protein [Verrucomicrobiota bacterium]
MSSDTTPANGLMQIRISGAGGQGIVLAGMLLGKAASLYDQKEAVFTQSYGPEARGGASCADIVVSSGTIDYPLVEAPDVLVVLFQEAYLKYRPTLTPGGILIIESDLVKPPDTETDHLALPATALADELGRRIVTNVIVLGYLIGKTDVVSMDAAKQAIETTVKPRTLDLNLRALDAGYDRAKSGA